MGRSDEQLAQSLNALLDELLELLDQLRDDLIGDLRDYESRLAQTLAEIPDDVFVDPQSVREQFRPTDDDESLLGPRMVAVIALEVEKFVSTWVGDQDAVVKLDFDASLIEDYRQNCANLEQHLTEDEDDARRCASELVSVLGDQLEDVLEILQDERDSDEKALADLVSEGDVDKGKSQLKENAGVWERYRKQAETITDVWERLEGLAFEGVDRTIEGLERLRQVIRHADAGLTDAYPDLAIEVASIEVPSRDEPDERATLELDRDSLGDKDTPEETEIERRTIELNRVGLTTESERPMATSDSTPSDDDPEQEASEPDVSEDEKREETTDQREAFWASRTITAWQPVPRLEIGLVLGIPAVFFAVVGIAAIAPNAVDPFDRFDWFWILCVIVGVATLAVPLFRGWRAHARSGSVRIEKRMQSEDEIRVELLEDGVKVGDVVIGATGQTSLYRWEQFNPPEIGWLIKSSGTTIGMRETNVTRWEDSSAKRKERPDTTWIAPPHEFWNICEILNLKR